MQYSTLRVTPARNATKNSMHTIEMGSLATQYQNQNDTTRLMCLTAKIIRYGERGVVDNLVNFLVNSGQSKQFLQAIRWVDDTKHYWIKDIKFVTWILEVSLNRMSGFGDPDIMLVCKTNDDTPYFVFIEAKVEKYITAAIPNSGGMVKGYNSRINGQLSLKYRFCKALKNWNRKERIIESETIFQYYRDKLGENNKRPRRLAKEKVLNLLRDQGFEKAKLERCFYVAMTWDREPGPFQNLDPDLSPLFLSETGDEIWDQLKGNVGWIGYGVIDRNFKLSDSFRETLETMVDSYPEPIEEK